MKLGVVSDSCKDGCDACTDNIDCAANLVKQIGEIQPVFKEAIDKLSAKPALAAMQHMVEAFLNENKDKLMDAVGGSETDEGLNLAVCVSVRLTRSELLLQFQ